MAGYAIVLDRGERYIVRTDAPNVMLRVERGLVVGERQRDGYPDQVVFLDGVYAGPPFIDNVRRHYALDHHHGVVRAFTLATCEQAAVMVALGLPLSSGIWRVYLNDPDLDALLGAWLLLNHDLLRAHDDRLLAAVMPLIRVEGNIDAYGFEMQAVSGINPRTYAVQKARLDRLRLREVELVRKGEWSRHDVMAYTLEQLGLIDLELVGKGRREVIARSAVRRAGYGGRKLAVLWSSGGGNIYEVEEALRTRYGDALGLIVLDRGDGHVTLLQVDPFLPKSLHDVYHLLDAADPKARPAEGNSWGGAAEIGGSPRRTGTGLRGEQILRLVSRVFALEGVRASKPAPPRAQRSTR